MHLGVATSRTRCTLNVSNLLPNVPSLRQSNQIFKDSYAMSDWSARITSKSTMNSGTNLLRIASIARSRIVLTCKLERECQHRREVTVMQKNLDTASLQSHDTLCEVKTLSDETLMLRKELAESGKLPQSMKVLTASEHFENSTS